MSLFQWIKNQNYAYIVLILVLAFFCYDITEDLIEGDSEVLLEALVMILISHALYREARASSRLKVSLAEQHTRLSRLSGEFIKVVTLQFEHWNLTRTEKEVGWMILKGYSFNDVASFRDSREKTVRHHAAQIYAKSKTANRSEFAAFFLEDLLIEPYTG
jgi:DNA-binding NarL/FixJ family response regulator